MDFAQLTYVEELTSNKNRIHQISDKFFLQKLAY